MAILRWFFIFLLLFIIYGFYLAYQDQDSLIKFLIRENDLVKSECLKWYDTKRGRRLPELQGRQNDTEARQIRRLFRVRYVPPYGM